MSQLHARLERLRLPALTAYVLVIMLATLTPFRIDLSPENIRWRMIRAITPNLRIIDIVDAARNVVLFAGWGLVWMATAPRGRAWREVRRATLWGAAISIVVEFCQLFARNRFSSINDVVTNTVGGFLGALCFALVVFTLLKHRDRKSYFGLPAILLATSYGTGVILEAVIPLFRDTLGRVRGGPFTRAEIIFARYNWRSIFDIPWEEILLFAPAGALVVLAMVEGGTPHQVAARRTAIGGLLLCCLAELIHAPLGIPIIGGILLTHALAIAAGAYATARWLPAFSQNVRGVDRPRILMAGYAFLLMLWAWRPYMPEFNGAEYVRKLHEPFWLPLAMSGRWGDFYIIADISVPFFLGVPLGALLAVWPLRREGGLRTALPGIYLAFVLEAGQLFIVGRSPDITDFLIAAAGVALGWLCLRRAGFQPYGELLRRAHPDPVPAK